VNDSIQNGVAMAAIAATCTIAGQCLGWLRDRDKLRYDKTLTDQAAKIETQAGQIAGLTAQNTSQAGQIEAWEKKHEECEQKHKTMESRLDQLERRLEPTRGETADHTPRPN
jgi:chromosome segregation ATPase